MKKWLRRFRHRGEEPAQLGPAEHHRQPLRLPGKGDLLDDARLLQRGAVEKPERAHRLVEQGPGGAPGLDQDGLIGPDVLRPQLRR
jgi:hypothetical protein